MKDLRALFLRGRLRGWYFESSSYERIVIVMKTPVALAVLLHG